MRSHTIWLSVDEDMANEDCRHPGKTTKFLFSSMLSKCSAWTKTASPGKPIGGDFRIRAAAVGGRAAGPSGVRQTPDRSSVRRNERNRRNERSGESRRIHGRRRRQLSCGRGATMGLYQFLAGRRTAPQNAFGRRCCLRCGKRWPVLPEDSLSNPPITPEDGGPCAAHVVLFSYRIAPKAPSRRPR